MATEQIWMDPITYLTGALVLITGYYAYVTHRIAKANDRVVANMDKQLEATSRPYIVCSLDVRRGQPVIVLNIRNIGRTPATNVQLQLDRDFFQWGQTNRSMKSFDIFSRTIGSFAPNEAITIELGAGFELLGENSINPTEFTITATYTGEEREYNEDIHIDLKPYSKASFHDPMASALKDIKEELKIIGQKIK